MIRSDVIGTHPTVVQVLHQAVASEEDHAIEALMGKYSQLYYLLFVLQILCLYVLSLHVII